MTTFYICRHGETENNKNQRFSGWIDTPLTKEGFRNAESSAAKLHGIQFDKIISSDLGRAFVTAYIIARKLGYTDEIGRAEKLREVNYGDFANKPYSVYPEVTPTENTNYVSPGGESLAQMQQRVIDYIQTLSLANVGRTILLVGHDGTINAIRASFAGQEMGVADLNHNAHDFVGTFAVEDGRFITFEVVKA